MTTRKRRSLLALSWLIATGSMLTPTIGWTSVLIQFDLAISNTNPGPFTAGALVQGSLSIDDSIIPSGSGTFFLWTAAADNLSLTIDDPNLGLLSINGDNGTYTQQTLTGGSTSLAGNFNPGAGIGTLNPLQIVNPAKSGAGTTPFVLERVSFGFRVDTSLVASASEVVTAATLNDFGFLDLTLYFDHPTAGVLTQTSINRAGSFSALTISSDAVPTATTLTLGILLAPLLLAHACRRAGPNGFANRRSVSDR